MKRECVDQYSDADNLALLRWLEEVAPETLRTWREHFEDMEAQALKGTE